jgi:hypothetical protein
MAAQKPLVESDAPLGSRHLHIAHSTEAEEATQPLVTNAAAGDVQPYAHTKPPNGNQLLRIMAGVRLARHIDGAPIYPPTLITLRRFEPAP